MPKNKKEKRGFHSMDHPDVIAIAKNFKKDREKTKKKFPILSKLTGNSKRQ
jgi:hypothetical protein